MTVSPIADPKKATLLASLVTAGDAQTEATAITDFLFMSQDVSNAYLVTTRDGDVLVNTGSPEGGERHKRLFAPHRTGPLRYIALTQSHYDHLGGVPALREPATKIVAHNDFEATRQSMAELGAFFLPRTAKLWGTIVPLNAGQRRSAPVPVGIDIPVDDKTEFTVGERAFEVISTPGGETLDSVCVWLPKEKVVFTGNLFGPVFLSMPFLNTLRGDKPRSVDRYLRSLERVRDLGAEILVTGHGEPIRGAAKVRTDLTRMHDAVSYVRNQTIAGMNAGKDVHTLMREIKLPPEIEIAEAHGNVRWAVKTIWEEFAGWFHYDSTTSLYGVPRSSVDADLAELAGGADRLAERAARRVAAGEPLQAIHLVDIALGADPACRPALEAKKQALEMLLAQSGQKNLSETMWLGSEIAAVNAGLA
jgi:glyoxylase-like metal-dependent hydrolase (beta-lactamase superfamily II)